MVLRPESFQSGSQRRKYSPANARKVGVFFSLWMASAGLSPARMRASMSRARRRASASSISPCQAMTMRRLRPSMNARPVPRVAEQRRRRIRSAERPVVAHIDPGPPGGALAPGQHRHRGVVAMQTIRRHDMGRDQIVQGLQRHRARADLVGQGRQAQIDAFARVAVALPIQRLMLAVLLEQDRRQQVGARPAPRRRMKRRRRLRDLLASPAGEFLAHRLDHLPPARDGLQRLGHVLADLRQLLRSNSVEAWYKRFVSRLAEGQAASGIRNERCLHLDKVWL